MFLHLHLSIHNDKLLSLLLSDPRLNDVKDTLRLVIYILPNAHKSKQTKGRRIILINITQTL